jgi:alanyl-tRNA synthetase
VELLLRELDALEREVERASVLEGRALADRLPALTRALDGWPCPPRRVAELRQRHLGLERRLEEEKRSRRVSSRAQRVEIARQLLADASKLGGTTLVIHHLGEASAQHLRALAEQLRKAATHAAVVLTGTQGDTVTLVAAATPALIQRGVDAAQVLAHAAPAVEGGAHDGTDVAWTEGSRPEGIALALEAALQYLQARLGGDA